jgi:hypothetical protein
MGKLKMSTYTPDVISERVGQLGLITLNRPKALNALSLPMVRERTHVLLQWQQDPEVQAVVVRGSNKEGPFGAYCAGGDIRYFHQAALSGDATLEDFFTEEYSLNHLIQNYRKPYIALMDGIVMGGGMGISQGASLGLVTEHTRMAQLLYIVRQLKIPQPCIKDLKTDAVVLQGFARKHKRSLTEITELTFEDVRNVRRRYENNPDSQFLDSFCELSDVCEG